MKRAALFAIGGQKLRDLLKTLTPEDTSYDVARTVLNKHLTSRKNVTTERYKFFCTKPLGPDECHDRWITRLRTAVRDCEFKKMNIDEAITLVITLYTTSEKLQTYIIQKNMNLTKVNAVAKSIEIAQWENKFMKSNILQQSTHEHMLNAVSKQQHQRYRPRPTSTTTTTTYPTSTTQVASRQHNGKCKT